MLQTEIVILYMTDSLNEGMSYQVTLLCINNKQNIVEIGSHIKDT